MDMVCHANKQQTNRKDAVPLVDAFGYADFVLKAPLGCYDGDIYRKYFEVLRDAPQTHINGRPFYYEEEIAPMIRGISKLWDSLPHETHTPQRERQTCNTIVWLMMNCLF